VKKYISYGLLIALSALFLIACSSNRDATTPDVSESIQDGFSLSDDMQIVGLPTGEYTYVRSDISLGDDIDMISVITVFDGTIYGVAEIWNDNRTHDSIQFFSINANSEEIIFYALPGDLAERYSGIQSMAVNSSGDITFVLHEFVWDDSANTTDVLLTLIQMNLAGYIVFSVDITEHFDHRERPQAIALDEEENIYMQSVDGGVLIFDSNGVYKSTISSPGAVWTAGDLFLGAEGIMLIPLWLPDEGGALFRIDYETQSLLPHHQLPDADNYVPGLRKNEVLLLTDIGVYSYCMEEGEQERLFHWLDLEMFYVGGSVFPVNESQFALLDWASSHFPDAVTVLNRTAAQEDTRTIVTLASLQPNYSLVRDFNEQSTQYRIVVLDYSDADISNAVTQFNINMIAGQIPDIIDLALLDYSVLANGGFLTDLNKWFENENRISRSDYFDRVFELLEIDGSLYALTTAFFIGTYVAPASLVGSTPGITLDRLMQLDEQFNNGQSLLHAVCGRLFLDWYLWTNRSTLIDLEAGTAHFETYAFLKALEYAYRLEQGEIFVERPFEEEVRHGRSYISPQLFSNIALLHYLETISGTELTAIGFPVTDGVGSLMIPTSLYGIGNGAENPSGAWEFLCFLLAEQQQQEMAFAAIPVSRAVLYGIAYNLMNPEPLDSPEIGDGIFLDGVLIEVAPLSADQVDRFLDMIESLDAILTGGEELIAHIVLEESDEFLNGHRSASDTARIIQNRVSIYVSERHR